MNWCAFSVAALTIAGASAEALAGAVPLATYRAVYDLVIEDTGESPDIASMTGRLAVELTGSKCAGYTNNVRYVTRIEDSEGERQIKDLRSNFIETPDGRFDFKHEDYTDQELTEQSSGIAERKDEGIVVNLTKPGAKTFTLDRSVVFPTEQLTRVIDSAARGESFVPLDLYDGGQNGELFFATATVIGPATVTGDDPDEETVIRDAGFAGQRHWLTTTSLFRKDTGTDDMPTVVMSFVLYENGIQRAIRFDYGNFAVAGKITHLEILPGTPCP